MQGKILSPQLISGDDGKRYEYDKNDVVNLGDKDLAVLTGSVVDFVSFDERVAKSIYIISENVNVSGILSADRIRPARTKALWGLGLQLFSFIPYIGLIIAIVGFVLYSMAIYSVSKAAASKSLFKNYIKLIISGFLGSFIFFIPAFIMLASSEHASIGARMIPVLLLAMFALIVTIYFYKIHAELARLSGSSLFLWSFWVYNVGVLLYLVYFFFVYVIFIRSPNFNILKEFASILLLVGYAVSFIAWVLLFIAWWRFGKVEKRA